MFLKPKSGIQVRGPQGEILPPEGGEVVDSPYWRRRLRDGDVEKAQPKAASTSPAASPVASTKNKEA